MNLDFVVKLLEEHGDFSLTGNCIDCNKDTTVSVSRTDDGQIQIEGGAAFKPPDMWNCPTEYLLKCPECFEKSAKFYPKTEVYSRIVGYMRPTSQWNEGKKSEFAIRKTFNCCDPQ